MDAIIPLRGSLLPANLHLQIERVEALGEPAVDRREQFACLAPLALTLPKPGHARCSAQFKGDRLLLSGNFESLNETSLGLLR